MSDEKTNPSVRGTTPVVTQMAQAHRREMTYAERRLWEAIRGKQLDGLRFRTQHAVGRFILDFYCPSIKLVVEVDGSVHDTTQEHDDARTAYLAAYGYTVVRVTNDEVEKDLPTALERIRAAASLCQVPLDPTESDPA